MKIILISSFYGLDGGGAGLIAEFLAKNWCQAGHDVVVITLGHTHHSKPTRNDGIKFYRFSPFNLYPLDQKNSQPVWKRSIWQLIDIYNPHTALTLNEILSAENPDVINIQKMRGFSGAVWSVSSKLYPGRVIQTCQDYESISPIGTLEGRLGEWVKRRDWKLEPYRIIRRLLTKNISWVISPSKFTLDQIVANGLFATAKEMVIPNTHGLTVENISARMQAGTNQKHKDSPLTFLYLGRLEPEKGVQMLLDAFSSLSKSHSNIQLQIAGWGSLEQPLKQKWGQHSAIKFLGKVDGSEKDKILSEMDVLIVPSTWPEVFGIVSVEALAFGKPVIASNAGGLPENITEGKTGWLFESGSVQSLQDRMEYAVHHSSILGEMSENCFMAAKRYAVDEVAQEYLYLFEQVILARL